MRDIGREGEWDKEKERERGREKIASECVRECVWERGAFVFLLKNL